MEKFHVSAMHQTSFVCQESFQYQSNIWVSKQNITTPLLNLKGRNFKPLIQTYFPYGRFLTLLAGKSWLGSPESWFHGRWLVGFQGSSSQEPLCCPCCSASLWYLDFLYFLIFTSHVCFNISILKKIVSFFSLSNSLIVWVEFWELK